MDYLVRRVEELEGEIYLEQNSEIVKIKTENLVEAKERLFAIIQAKVQSEIRMTEAAHEAELEIKKKAHEFELDVYKRKAEVELAIELAIKKRKTEVELAILTGE
jgi:hypothetical protein